MIRTLWDWSGQLSAGRAQGRLRQWHRMLQARRKAGIGVSEFYEYELFDAERYAQLDRCVGRRASGRIDALMNDDSWRATVNDKVLHYTLLEHHGIPTARTQAVYRINRAGIADEEYLDDAEALHDFLATRAAYPLFIKPVCGTYGRGTFAGLSYAAGERVLLGPGARRAHLGDIVAAGAKQQHRGLLLQHALVPHPVIRAACGPSTSCVRIVVVRGDEAPFVHRACWKIARVDNITDNFSHGAHGNLLANVAVATGRVTRVARGVWPNSEAVTHHPDTRHRLLGLRIPDWDRGVALVLRASALFPQLRLQNWDVAFCADGPVLLECNTQSDLELPQLLDGRPFIDDRLLGVLEARGWPAQRRDQRR